MVRSHRSASNAARIRTCVNDGARPRRLFAGIALDDVAREACASVAERLQRCGFDARYEDAAKLHVTLAFLGNVAPARFGQIVAAFESGARGAPFALSLDRLGAFPHERKPRVVYIGAREQGVEFRRLAHVVRHAYEAIGFAFDGDAVAHVTLGRIKHPQRPLPSIDLTPIPLRVEELSLFESIFDPKANTSRYETIGSAPLLMSS